MGGNVKHLVPEQNKRRIRSIQFDPFEFPAVGARQATVMSPIVFDDVLRISFGKRRLRGPIHEPLEAWVHFRGSRRCGALSFRGVSDGSSVCLGRWRGRDIVRLREVCFRHRGGRVKWNVYVDRFERQRC